MEESRLDVELVRRGLFVSREKACDAIKNSQVQVKGKTITKPAYMVSSADDIILGEQLLPYVSKGGLKLEKAIEQFHLNFEGKTVLDVGCSTGGFADCALQHGALCVYGIDVGTNQLDNRLKNEKRLTYIENLNVKDVNLSHMNGCRPDWVVADVSFISLTYIFPYIKPLLHAGSELVLLIKPQFELSAASLDRNGIVRNAKHHIMAIERVVHAAATHGLYWKKIDYAPLMSYKKNIEYIVWLTQTPQVVQSDFAHLVNTAFAEKKKMK